MRAQCRLGTPYSKRAAVLARAFRHRGLGPPRPRPLRLRQFQNRRCHRPLLPVSVLSEELPQMRSSPPRPISLSLIVLGAALLAQRTGWCSAEPTPHSGTSSSMLSLSATPPEQSASSPRLLLTLKNTSERELFWSRQPWCILVGVTIVDSSGRMQAPDIYHRPGCVGVEASFDFEDVRLSPGATYRGYGSELQFGVPLIEWGFTLQPGVYSIRVFPVALLQNGDHSATDSIIGSTTMTITLR